MYNGFMRYANTLDLFGANVYGSAATGFVGKVTGISMLTGWGRPFFASEFGATNWFNAPYTGAITTTGSSALQTYLEDTSAVKGITYQTAYQNFIAGASLALNITPSFNVTQGGGTASFLGCYAFQYGYVQRVRARGGPWALQL